MWEVVLLSDRRFLSCNTLLVALALVCSMIPSRGLAQLPEDSNRRTPLVNAIEALESSVVAVFSQKPDTAQGVTGSGAIIHPKGYVLTNDHILVHHEGYAVHAGRAVRFQVVGRLPEKDMAIVKLIGGEVWPAIEVGSNQDLMNGESVIAAGNPGGRGIVFTSGIVSRKSLAINSGNALVMTQFSSSEGRDTFIQFDAASNQGSSGGPLINIDKQLIGIVSGGFLAEQNGNYAIPIDRVRNSALAILEPEARNRQHLGLVVDPLASEAVITLVEPDSAAQRVGLIPGDTIEAAGAWRIANVLDWAIALHNLLPDSDSLTISVRRNGERKEFLLDLAPEARKQAASQSDVPTAKAEGSLPGVNYKFFSGQFDRLPVFADLQATKTGTAGRIELADMATPGSEYFALSIEANLAVTNSGLHRIRITSDDGSRVFVDGELLIDNDLNHPPQPLSRLIYLDEGRHPIRIEYYQATGGAALQLELFAVDNSTLDAKPIPVDLVR